jgi:preprotein translocase subunit YajC
MLTLAPIGFMIAQAQGEGAASLAPTFMLFGMVFLIWWLLVLRPQNKKRNAHQEFLNALKAGDEVITAGGIFGKVQSVDERSVVLEVSKGSKMKVLRDQIRGAAPTPSSGS